MDVSEKKLRRKHLLKMF